ncbi:MAG TPA: transketolase C-terminal domain-containing protein, partial [Solirubrobacterales bacterium]|nr:transketolase C-terminal domain-containing protein [Solirubrobacterales bacterium]
SPLDRPAIVESVRKTGRVVVAQDATAPCSIASEVCAIAAESCLAELKTEPVRVTSPFINVPTPVPLAEARAPGVDDIAAALRECAGKGS